MFLNHLHRQNCCVSSEYSKAVWFSLICLGFETVLLGDQILKFQTHHISSKHQILVEQRYCIISQKNEAFTITVPQIFNPSVSGIRHISKSLYCLVSGLCTSSNTQNRTEILETGHICVLTWKVLEGRTVLVYLTSKKYVLSPSNTSLPHSNRQYVATCFGWNSLALKYIKNFSYLNLCH
jgi:hypothetical protein